MNSWRFAGAKRKLLASLDLLACGVMPVELVLCYRIDRAIWPSCRFSIHAKHKKSEEMGAALDEMPLLVPGTENVFHLVMASESSFGAASYLLRRPEGNVGGQPPL